MPTKSGDQNGAPADNSAPTNLSAKTSGHPAIGQRKTGKKRKKRVRGQKAKVRVVTPTGEEPRERKLRKGNVRELDILRGNPENDTLPRKTREMLARMARFRSEDAQQKGKPHGSGTGGNKRNQRLPDQSKGGAQPVSSAGDERHESSNTGSLSATEGRESKPDRGRDANALGKAGVTDANGSAKKKKFDGMQPGETFAQFSARLRKESKKMILEAARKGNHQREKKRAYYEKQRERMERKKRRKRGEYSDSDVEEEDEDDYQATAHLPSYWQEILRNNGRPISAKRRKRLHRSEANKTGDEVVFGEQAERPPELSVLPVRRGQR